MAARKKVWYLDIGRNSGNSGNYVRMEIFHDPDPNNSAASDLSTGRVEVIGQDENGANVLDLTESQIQKFRIKFVKRRYDGFRFDINNDDDRRKELLELKFKGGDVNSTRIKERENYYRRKVIE